MIEAGSSDRTCLAIGRARSVLDIDDMEAKLFEDQLTIFESLASSGIVSTEKHGDDDDNDDDDSNNVQLTVKFAEHTQCTMRFGEQPSLARITGITGRS